MLGIILSFFICVSSAFASTSDDAVAQSQSVLRMRIQVLDNQISILTQERDRKKKELAECRGDEKALKVAGVSTLVATAGGVVANVVLNDKLQNMTGGGSSRSGKVKDDRPPVLDFCVNVIDLCKDEPDPSDCRKEVGC